jgi:hypothetical protein
LFSFQAKEAIILDLGLGGVKELPFQTRRLKGRAMKNSQPLSVSFFMNANHEYSIDHKTESFFQFKK